MKLFTLPRAAIGFWLVLLVGIGGRVAVADPHSQSVVPIYTSAGAHWLSAIDLYAPVWGQDVYRNPPAFAALFAPLATLPDRAAGLVWRATGAVVFLLGLREFLRHVLPPLDRSHAAGVYLGAGLLAIPSLNNGQVNVVLAGAVMLGAAAVARGRGWPAAGWLSAAAWLKLYPVAVGMLLCGAAPKRLTPRFAVAVLAGFAVPFLVQSPDYVLEQYRSMMRLLQLDDRCHTIIGRAPRDWTILARAWADYCPCRVTTEAVSAAAGLLFALVVWRTSRRDTVAGVRAAVGLGMVWMTVFGPATEHPTYTLLAPVAAAAVATSVGMRRRMATAAFGLLLLPVLRGLFPTSDVCPLRTLQPVAGFLLMGVVIADAVTAPVSSPAPVVAPACRRGARTAP